MKKCKLCDKGCYLADFQAGRVELVNGKPCIYISECPIRQDLDVSSLQTNESAQQPQPRKAFKDQQVPQTKA